MSLVTHPQSPAIDVSTPRPVAKPRGLFGPFTDVITLGGLSLLALPLLWLMNSVSPLALPDGRVAGSIVMLLMFATYAVNYPHYAATYARAYRSRASIREYWWSCLAVPVGLIVLAGLALTWPTDGVPWYFKAYLIVSGYHYCGQTYGVALIFANQAKLKLSKREKRIVMLPIYSAWLYSIGVLEVTGAAPLSFAQEMAIAPIGLPTWMADVSAVLFGVGVVAYAGLNVVLYRRGGRGLPTVSHIAVAAHATWFVAGPYSPLFANFVPFFHCLQYLMITTYFQMKGQPNTAGDSHPTVSFIKYYGLLIALGFVMYEATPLALTALGVTTLAYSTAVVVAFINLHHFIMDGEIWKLRKPENRTA
jgi:hypothetical protein